MNNLDGEHQTEKVLVGNEMYEILCIQETEEGIQNKYINGEEHVYVFSYCENILSSLAFHCLVLACALNDVRIYYLSKKSLAHKSLDSHEEWR